MKARPAERPPEFAFFGAGEASYFEWAEVHVRFARKPSKEEQKQIAARVPPPLQDSIDFEDQHLMAASGQFAHVAMASAYPGNGDPSDESQWDEGRWFFADAEQVAAFNKDIELWLYESDAICPIVCVYRAEDHESGGTDLSSWHRQSMSQLQSVLQRCEDALTKPNPPEQHMITGILRMGLEAKLSIPGPFLAWSMRES